MDRASKLLVVASLLLWTSTVSAQALSPYQFSKYEPDVYADIDPEFPHPGDTVLIELQSSAIDLSRSSITWSVDGKEIKSGVGTTLFETIAPKGGGKSTVTVSIRSSDGE